MLAEAYKDNDEDEIERWTKAKRRAEENCPACRNDRPVIN